MAGRHETRKTKNLALKGIKMQPKPAPELTQNGNSDHRFRDKFIGRRLSSQLQSWTFFRFALNMKEVELCNNERKISLEVLEVFKAIHEDKEKKSEND